MPVPVGEEYDLAAALDAETELRQLLFGPLMVRDIDPGSDHIVDRTITGYDSVVRPRNQTAIAAFREPVSLALVGKVARGKMDELASGRFDLFGR